MGAGASVSGDVGPHFGLSCFASQAAFASAAASCTERIASASIGQLATLSFQRRQFPRNACASASPTAESKLLLCLLDAHPAIRGLYEEALKLSDAEVRAMGELLTAAGTERSRVPTNSTRGRTLLVRTPPSPSPDSH